jgi:mannose-6-phosphate isomerase
VPADLLSPFPARGAGGDPPLYPLRFRPIFQERVWGGRNLETLYAKPLPPNLVIGESWEISDRPGAVSVIANGPLAGIDLHALVETRGQELLGRVPPLHGRFPLLIKILDAQETLSLQVHPPESALPRTGGDPKTEMWYVTSAQSGAHLFAGLKRGVTRELFERKLAEGTVAECFHRLNVRPGDAMFVPSGRVHAIGAGCVLFEVQQNSDTTFRVFDWNRVGLDGKPRALHVAQSLDCIDFQDFEPALADTSFSEILEGVRVRRVAECPFFRVAEMQFQGNVPQAAGEEGQMQIIAGLEGSILIEHATEPVRIKPGEFGLIPASVGRIQITPQPGARCLRVLAQ